MATDREIAEILSKQKPMTVQDWKRLRELKRYRRESLVPGAEKILRWNMDKGNTG